MGEITPAQSPQDWGHAEHGHSEFATDHGDPTWSR